MSKLSEAHVKKIMFARTLKAKPTASEQLLWQYLRTKDRQPQLGYKFCRQHCIKGFIVDFWCPSKMLAIELDGPYHDNQQEYDQWRDSIIKDFGATILRFKNDDLKDINHVLTTIKETLDSLPWYGAISFDSLNQF